MTWIGEDELEIVDERLVDGEWQVFHQEIFPSGDTSWEESGEDAYERSKILYVGDGYWDLY